jgi:hypothetical protein
MTTRRSLTVKAPGLNARTTFFIEAYRGKVWIKTYECSHVCLAILEPAQAASLIDLITQTTEEVREHRL